MHLLCVYSDNAKGLRRKEVPILQLGRNMEHIYCCGFNAAAAIISGSFSPPRQHIPSPTPATARASPSLPANKALSEAGQAASPHGPPCS